MHLLSFEQWISTVFVKALGITFAHSIWQGTLALLVCYIVLAAAKKSAPAARYNLLLIVSLVLGAAILTTFGLQFKHDAFVSADNLQYTPLQNIIDNNNHIAAPVVSQSKKIMSLAADMCYRYMDVIMTIWFIIFCVKWLQLSLGMNYVKRITMYGSAQVGEEWQSVFSSLKNKVGINRAIRFLQSDIVKVPMAAGFFKPVIIIPASMLLNLPADTVKSILLHELAHIRRKDYLVNLLQAAAETIFFFNPFIIKISSLLKEEREACCDAIAVDAVQSKATYVKALVSFGEFANNQPLSALGFGGQKNSLLFRVKRILFNQNKKPGVMEKTILACSLVLLIGLAVFSTAKGTEKKLKTVFMNQLSALVTDTVPSPKAEEKMNRREERKARKREKEEVEIIEKKNDEDLQQALDEISKEQERLNEKRAAIIEKRKILIEKDVRDREDELSNLDIDREEIKARSEKHAHEAEKQLKLIEAQTLNSDLQNALADAQVQIQKTITLKNNQQLELQKYLNDSLVVKLKNINFNINNGIVDQVLQFLTDNKVVAKAKEVTSFSLDENELKVNGKVQPTSLHEQLKKKYIHKKDDHINFMKSGDGITISIQKNDDPETDDAD